MKRCQDWRPPTAPDGEAHDIMAERSWHLGRQQIEIESCAALLDARDCRIAAAISRRSGGCVSVAAMLTEASYQRQGVPVLGGLRHWTQRRSRA